MSSFDKALTDGTQRHVLAEAPIVLAGCISASRGLSVDSLVISKREKCSCRPGRPRDEMGARLPRVNGLGGAVSRAGSLVAIGSSAHPFSWSLHDFGTGSGVDVDTGQCWWRGSTLHRT